MPIAIEMNHILDLIEPRVAEDLNEDLEALCEEPEFEMASTINKAMFAQAVINTNLLTSIAISAKRIADKMGA